MVIELSLNIARNISILDYGRPARPKWLQRSVPALSIIFAITIGALIGGAIGDLVQPDLYTFNSSLSVPSFGDGTVMPVIKEAHIGAIRANIPAAAALLSIKGTPISASELSSRLILKDVPQSPLISIRCTSRSSEATLAIVNALIIPYCDNGSGLKAMRGTLDRSVRDASVGSVLGGAATGLIIVWRRRRLAGAA